MADRTKLTRTDGVPREVSKKLAALYERDQERAWRSTASKLQTMHQSFSEERGRILSPGLREKIASAAKRSAGEDRRGPGLRYRSLVEAKNAGVDLAALKALHSRAYGQAGDIMKGDSAFQLQETVMGPLADVLERPPIIFPDPDKEKVFWPPFGGPLETYNQNQTLGDATIIENSSYLDGSGRLGSKLVARDHDASDVDFLCAARHGGYVVPFTTLRTGPLQVRADLSALVCTHRISTEDEFGWSDFVANTRGGLTMAVFWDLEDAEPDVAVHHPWFIAGLQGAGDGESFPGTTTQALPGERRIVSMFTETAFAAGSQVWVYVGLADRIFAVLNDVSIDISIDSAWVLNSLAIRSL